VYIRQLFAANLRRIRHDKRISQEDLAYDAGIDRAHISKLERGIVYAGLEIVEKLTKVLSVTPIDLIKPLPRRGSKK
jgi:transcriptional regulator with XRE-family HTH domain